MWADTSECPWRGSGPYWSRQELRRGRAVEHRTEVSKLRGAPQCRHQLLQSCHQGMVSSRAYLPNTLLPFLPTPVVTVSSGYCIVFFQVHIANKQPALAAALSLELGNILKVSVWTLSIKRSLEKTVIFTSVKLHPMSVRRDTNSVFGHRLISAQSSQWFCSRTALTIL